MSATADLSVARSVVDELIRLAAMEVPGVVRVDAVTVPYDVVDDSHQPTIPMSMVRVSLIVVKNRALASYDR